MNRTVQILLVGIAIIAGILAASAVGEGRKHATALTDLRQQLAAHIAEHDVQDADRAEQQQKRDQVLRSELDEIRRDLDGVLTRKPPAVETRWIENRFNRHEQRIGALEYERWKQR